MGVGVGDELLMKTRVKHKVLPVNILSDSTQLQIYCLQLPSGESLELGIQGVSGGVGSWDNGELLVAGLELVIVLSLAGPFCRFSDGLKIIV